LNDKKNASNLLPHLLLIYFLTRIGLEAIGILSLFYFPSARAVFPMRDFVYHKPAAATVEIWARWDSEWYQLIADHGYASFDFFKEAGGGRYAGYDIAKYFPLYPLTIRMVSYLVGNTLISGILISNLAALLFLYYFYQLGTKLIGPEKAAQSALFYIVYPTSFLLNAIYSEPLFLACVVAGFFYLEDKKLIPALFAIALSVLCRPSGILALPAFLWLGFIRFPEKRFRVPLLISFACMISIAVYCYFMWSSFGDLSVIVKAQDHWRGPSKYPLFALVRFFTNAKAIHGQHNSFLDFSFALIHLLVLAVSFRTLKAPYYLYSIICVLFPLSSTLFSFMRLSLINFPFFLFLGSQLSGRWALVIQILSAMLLSFFMAAFANWYWVG
jgi:Gpi18-like mannosyltransferase